MTVLAQEAQAARRFLRRTARPMANTTGIISNSAGISMTHATGVRIRRTSHAAAGDFATASAIAGLVV